MLPLPVNRGTFSFAQPGRDDLSRIGGLAVLDLP